MQKGVFLLVIFLRTFWVFPGPMMIHNFQSVTTCLKLVSALTNFFALFDHFCGLSHLRILVSALTKIRREVATFKSKLVCEIGDFPDFFRKNSAFYSLRGCNSPVRACIPIRRATPTGELQPQTKQKAIFFRKKSEKSRISHTKMGSKMATFGLGV